MAGNSWEEGGARKLPHEYRRDGTAKLLALFHPQSGEVRARGVKSCMNVVLHGWLKEELAQDARHLAAARRTEHGRESQAVAELAGGAASEDHLACGPGPAADAVSDGQLSWAQDSGDGAVDV